LKRGGASAADVLDHGLFLDQLSDELRTGRTTPTSTRVCFHDRLPLLGLTVSPAIWQDHFDIREAITALAAEMNALMTVDEAYRLDRYIDDAIVHAMAAQRADQ
jgi:hypothetical protein